MNRKSLVALLGSLTLIIGVAAGCTNDSDASKVKPKPAIASSKETKPSSASQKAQDTTARLTVADVEVVDTAVLEIPTSKANPGMAFLRFHVVIENIGTIPFEITGSHFKLELTDAAETQDYPFFFDLDKGIPRTSKVPSGRSRKIQLTWELTAPTQGSRYKLLWDPDMDGKSEGFLYSHP